MICYLRFFLLTLSLVQAHENLRHDIITMSCFDDTDCNTNEYCYNGHCVLLTKSEMLTIFIVVAISIFVIGIIGFVSMICCAFRYRNQMASQNAPLISYDAQYSPYDAQYNPHHAQYSPDPFFQQYQNPVFSGYEESNFILSQNFGNNDGMAGGFDGAQGSDGTGNCI